MTYKYGDYEVVHDNGVALYFRGEEVLREKTALELLKLALKSGRDMAESSRMFTAIKKALS